MWDTTIIGFIIIKVQVIEIYQIDTTKQIDANMKTNVHLIILTIVLLLLSSVNLRVSSQISRTSFLMKDTHYRMRLNPALTPSRGYVDIPVIGNFDVGLSSNPIGFQDVLDIIDDNGSIANNDVLFGLLANQNRMNLALNTDVISAGWWKGDNFWSMNVGLRTDLGAQVPKSMFDFIRDMDDISDIEGDDYRFDIEGIGLNLNVYTEIGVGFAREINDRLSVGGKVKLLVGMGNLNLDIKKIQIVTEGDGDFSEELYWLNGGRASIEVNAALESSFKGMELIKDDEGMIDDYDFNSFGIGGYGGAVDLGFTYKIMDNLTLSAAVNDLGFISWSKESTNIFEAETSREYNKDNYEEFLNTVEDGEILNLDLFGFNHEGQTKSRTTSLYSTIVAGAEYALMNDKVAVGVLSTTRMLKPKTLSELTFSAAVRPASWFNLAASYSVIQSAGSSFGLAMKLGPLFLGSDYVFLGNNSKAVDAYLGIAIPLARNKNI